MTPPAAYPMPVPDRVTRFFWDGLAAHELRIQRCRRCHHFIHWPMELCPACLSDDLAYDVVSGRGALYSYTVAVHAFHPGVADLVPYLLAFVELEEQENLRLVSQLVDCAEEDATIGMPLEVVLEEMAPGLTLPLFRPSGR